MESSRNRGFECFVRITLATIVLIQYLAMPFSVQAAQPAHANLARTPQEQVQALRQRTNETDEAYIERMSVEQPELVQNAAMIAVQDVLNGASDGEGDLESSIINQIDGAIDAALADPDLGAPPEPNTNLDADGTYHWETNAFDADGQVSGAWAMQADLGSDVDQAAFEEAFEAGMDSRLNQPDEQAVTAEPVVDAQPVVPQPFDPFAAPLDVVVPSVNAETDAAPVDVAPIVEQEAVPLPEDAAQPATPPSDTAPVVVRDAADSTVTETDAVPAAAGAEQRAAASCIIYVDADASGGYYDNGQSWDRAYNSLDAALDGNSDGGESRRSSDDCEIWVAEGVYTPSSYDGFTLQGGSLYGGFAGTETSLSQRDWQANPTILSGDRDNNDITENGVVTNPDNIRGSNAYTVLNIDSYDAVIDGFTITGASLHSQYGGGIEAYSNTTLQNLLIIGNRASRGGGVYGRGSLTIDNVTFRANVATEKGAALYIYGSTEITNSNFEGNAARYVYGGSNHLYQGGAIYINSGHVTLEDTLFYDNHAQGEGGAIYNDGFIEASRVRFISNSATGDGGAIYVQSGESNDGPYDPDPIDVESNLFAHNSSDGAGGAIYMDTGKAQVNTSTFVNNVAGGAGGGVTVAGGESDQYGHSDELLITSSIFWGNNSLNNQGEQFAFLPDGGSYLLPKRASVTNSLFPTNYNYGSGDDNGGGDVYHQSARNSQVDIEAIVGGDPFFIDADGPDNIPGTLDDNYNLSPGSPAIDRVYTSNLDIVGNPTRNDNSITHGSYYRDFGAYEAQYNSCSLSNNAVRLDPNADGVRTGSAWDKAMSSVGAAANLGVVCGVDVWMKAGVYTPGSNASDSFVLPEGAQLYGGFDGTEASRDERDIVEHPTILSGDIGDDDANKVNGVTTDPDNIVGTNSEHVVYITGANNRLDGFTITGGDTSANPSTGTIDGGGGILCDGLEGKTCTPTLSNLWIQGNRAQYAPGYGGGGILMLATQGGSASPTLDNVTLTYNSAAGPGGGLAAYNHSSTVRPTIYDSKVINNRASRDGGGMRFSGNGSIYTLRNVSFEGNTATLNGGGLTIEGTYTTLNLNQILFNGNQAGKEGGAIVHDVSYHSAGTITAINNTFVNNKAETGGAVHMNGGGSRFRAYNTILSGNQATTGNEINKEGTAIVEMDYTLLPSQTTADIVTPEGNPIIYGDNVMLGNPYFVDADGADDVAGNSDDNFQLMLGSIAIDSGHNEYLDNTNITTDLGNAPRFYDDPGVQDRGRDSLDNFGAIVDLGAFEYQSNSCVGFSGIMYVNQAATGDQSGTSWENAKHDLAQSMEQARACGLTVRIAGGVYTPGDNPSDSFIVRDDARIYGGYAGSGDNPDARDTVAHPTILSGDIGNDDTNKDANGATTHPDNIVGSNSEHVVILRGINANAYMDEETILDGLIITGGDSQHGLNGGGIWCDGTNGRTCSPMLSDLTILGNRAQNNGGGLFLDATNGTASPIIKQTTFRNNVAGNGAGIGLQATTGTSSPTLTDVTFDNNTATQQGGGLLIEVGSSGHATPTIQTATFTGNAAQSGAGGGIFVSAQDGGSSAPHLTSVQFVNNTATTYGGGVASVVVANDAGTPSSSAPVLRQVLFNNHSAEQGGAIAHQVSGTAAAESPSVMTLVNTTLVHNSANSDGGAIYNDASGQGGFNIYNTVFADNTATQFGNQVYNTADGTMQIAYSLLPSQESADIHIESGTVNIGDGVVTGDPLLEDSNGADDVAGNADDNLRLLQTSPAVDSGNPSYLPENGLERDLDGNPRTMGIQVDMGVYEYTPWVTINGLDNTVYDLEANSAGTIYAAGDFSGYVASFDGTNWTTLAGLDATADVLWVADNDTLYAAGTFTSGVAKWTGAAWEAVGTGLPSGTILDLIRAADGTFYAAGAFGVRAFNPATDSEWQAVGTLADVRAMAIYNGDLYAGGSFNNNTTPGHIARWDGTTWVAVADANNPTGLDGAVNALTVYADQLAIGGAFTAVADGIVFWDGKQYIKVNGVDIFTNNAHVTDFYVDGSMLAVAGDFDEADGVPAFDLAVWNGAAFAPALGGLYETGNHIKAVVMTHSDLYAGGNFERIGGRSTPNVGFLNVETTDLSLTLDSVNELVWPGSMNLMLTATNDGSESVDEATLGVWLPPGFTLSSDDGNCTASGSIVTCPVTSLQAGVSTSTVLTVSVSSNEQDPAIVIASIANGSKFDETPNNNLVVQQVDLKVDPDILTELGIDITTDATQASYEEVITYTVGVSNTGTGAGRDVLVTITLPSGGIFEGSDLAGCTASGSNRVLCDLDQLDTNATATFELYVKMTGNGRVTAEAEIADQSTTPQTFDDDVSNNTATSPQVLVFNEFRTYRQVGNVVIGANSFEVEAGKVTARGGIELGVLDDNDNPVYAVALTAGLDVIEWLESVENGDDPPEGEPALSGRGVVTVIESNLPLFIGDFKIEDAEDPVIAPSEDIEVELEQLEDFNIKSGLTYTGITLEDGTASIEAEIEITPPGVETSAQLIGQLLSDGTFTGEIGELNVSLAALSIDADNLQVADGAISAETITLTLSADLGGAIGTAGDLRITANSVSIGDIGAKIPLPDIPIGDGETVNLTNLAATIGYFGGAYSIKVEGTLELNLPDNEQKIKLTFSIDSNGNMAGSVDAITLNVAGAELALEQIAFSNSGLSIEAAVLTLPESLNGAKATVKNITIDENGLSFGGANVKIPFPQIRVGKYAVIHDLKAQLEVENDGGDLSFAFGVEGKVRVLIPDNLQTINFNATFKDGEMSGTVSTITINTMGSKMVLEGMAFKNGVFSLASAQLTLPETLGSTVITVTDVKISKDGLSIGGGSIEVPLPDIALGGESAAVQIALKDGSIKIEKKSRGLAFTVSGTVRVEISGNSAELKGSITVDFDGNISARLDSFALEIVGMEFNFEEVAFRNGVVSASVAGFSLPDAFGGLSAEVYGLRIGNGEFQISGGAFTLPEIKTGGMVIAVSGSFKREGSQYVITARGKFTMENLSTGPGCSGIDVSLTVSVNTARELVLDVQPVEENSPERDLALAQDRSLSGVSLRHVSVTAHCRIPITGTGFSLTEISGSLTLNGGTTRIELSVTIETDFQMLGAPALSSSPTLGLEKGPGYFQIDFGGAVEVFAMFEAARLDAMMRVGQKNPGDPDGYLSATLQINAGIIKGSTSVTAWTQNGSFHLVGNGRVSMEFEEGFIFEECLGSSWTGYWCITMPPFSLSIGFGVDFGEFHNGGGTSWGVKGYAEYGGYELGVYLDTSGRAAFGNVSRYHTITPPRLSRAAQLHREVSAGRMARAALSNEDIGLLDIYRFTDDATLLDVAVNDGDLLFNFLHAVDDEDILEMRLIRPDGLEISLNNLPANMEVIEHVREPEPDVLQLVQKSVTISEPARGIWQVKLIGADEATYDYILDISGSVSGPDLSDLNLEQVDDTHANVTWAVSSQVPTTTLNIYATQGPITITQVITPENGIAEESIADQFSGARVIGDVDTTLDGTPQTASIDFSEWESGEYWVWVDANDSLNPPTREYLPGKIIVEHPWDDAWIANTSLTTSFRSLDLSWDAHTNRDTDSYAVYLTPDGENFQSEDTYVREIGNGFDVELNGLRPNTEYAVKIVAVDLDTGREAHSEISTITVEGAPFSATANPTALTLPSGGSGTVQLTLTADEDPFPTATVLSVVGVSADVATTLQTDVITPTTAGVTSNIDIAVSSLLASGLHTVTVRASSGGDTRLIEIPVTVQEPIFDLRASAETITLTGDASTSVDIDATYLYGEDDDIFLALTDAPSGIDATFDTALIRVGEKATLTITDTNLLTNGTYTLTVAGNDGDNERLLDLTLVIDKPTFALRSESGLEAQTSHNKIVTYTLALDGDGWDTPVNVAVDALSLSGYLTPTIQLATRALIVPPATFNVIVEVADDATTPAGVYEMVLVATSDGVSETLPLQLAVGAENPQPDLQVSYDLSASEINAGDLLTVTTRYENRGAIALNSDLGSGFSHTRTITATEPLLIPVNTVGCDDLIAGTDVNGFDGDYRCDAFGTLEPGDTFTRTTVYRVHEGAEDGAIAAISETINTLNDFDADDNSWRAEIVVRNMSDVNVELSASTVSQNAGEDVTYTAVVRTNGNADVDGADVVFTPDALMHITSMSPSCSLVDGTVTCHVGAVQSGCERPTANDLFACVEGNATSQPVTVTVQIDPSATGEMSMAVTASSTLADANAANNHDSEALTVTTSSALNTNLIVGVEESAEGGTHSHTLVVTNNGPSVARNVTISYTLPAAASYDTLEVNGVGTDKTTPEIASGLELQPSESVTITMAIVHMQDTGGALVNSIIAIGATGETTQTVDLGRTVNNVAPEVTLVNPPIIVNEGETLRLTVTASDATPLDKVSPNWSVDWDLDNDGSYDDRTGNVAVIDATELDGVSNLARSATTTTIGVQATDGVASGQTSHTFTVRNIAPTVDAGEDQVQPLIQPFTINATFSDPAAADTHTAVMKWGDSTEEVVTVDGQSVTASHTYAAIGEYDAELCVTDDDGGEGCDKIELQASCLDHGLVASDLSYRFDNRKLIATTQLSYLGTLLPNPLPSEVALTMYNGDTAIDTVTVENAFALNHSSSVEFEWDMVAQDIYTLTVALDDDGMGNHPLSLCVSGKPDVEADTGIVTQAAPAAGESKVYGPTQVTIKQGLAGTPPGTITVTKVLEDAPDDGLIDARWVVEADEEENLDIELTICWAESDLTPEQAANEPIFTIYHRHEPTDHWSALLTDVDVDANCATASVSQFSEFTVGKAAATAVRLESLDTVANEDNSVTVNWETSQEVDHAGFNLYRRDVDTRMAWQAVNEELIASYGTQAQGAVYQFVDSDVPVGNWEYLLEDVEFDGDTYQHLAHIAAVQVGTPTAVQLSNAEIVATSPALLWMMSVLLLATTVQFVHARRKRRHPSRLKE